jgi:hypothetical protein
MVWRRLPTFFPNFPLRMMPLSESQAAQIRETGWVREAAFRTEPHVNKVRGQGRGGAPCRAHAVRAPSRSLSLSASAKPSLSLSDRDNNNNDNNNNALTAALHHHPRPTTQKTGRDQALP